MKIDRDNFVHIQHILAVKAQKRHNFYEPEIIQSISVRVLDSEDKTIVGSLGVFSQDECNFFFVDIRLPKALSDCSSSFRIFHVAIQRFVQNSVHYASTVHQGVTCVQMLVCQQESVLSSAHEFQFSWFLQDIQSRRLFVQWLNKNVEESWSRLFCSIDKISIVVDIIHHKHEEIHTIVIIAVTFVHQVAIVNVILSEGILYLYS